MKNHAELTHVVYKTLVHMYCEIYSHRFFTSKNHWIHETVHQKLSTKQLIVKFNDKLHCMQKLKHFNTRGFGREVCVQKHILKILTDCKGLRIINTSQSVYFLVCSFKKITRRLDSLHDSSSFVKRNNKKHFSIVKKTTILKLYVQFCLNENRGLFLSFYCFIDHRDFNNCWCYDSLKIVMQF